RTDVARGVFHRGEAARLAAIRSRTGTGPSGRVPGRRDDLRGRECSRRRRPRARLAYAHGPLLLSLLARRSRVVRLIDVAGLGLGTMAGQQGGAAEIVYASVEQHHVAAVGGALRMRSCAAARPGSNAAGS